MDAGVPVKSPVAGIAMGLVYHEGNYVTLTDILGAEDAFGDMDFKVAGTSEFVTALQLDTKIDGLPADVLAEALQQARDARLTILDVMHAAISEPRDTVGDNAPKIVSFEIPLDKIGEVIGPKGKVINAIQQETRRRHQRRRRRPGGQGHHRLDRQRCGRRGPAPDRADPRPAHGRGRPGLLGQGGEHHQVRRLREHPSGARRPGAHLQARRRPAHRPGRGRALSRRGDRGPGGRHRSPGQGLAHTDRRRQRRRDRRSGRGDRQRPHSCPGGRVGRPGVRTWIGAAPGSGGQGGQDSGSGREYVSFEDSFDAELREEFGELGPDREPAAQPRRGGDADQRGGGDRRRRRRR